MPGEQLEFDMSAALAEVSSGLGFDDNSDGGANDDGDAELDSAVSSSVDGAAGGDRADPAVPGKKADGGSPEGAPPGEDATAAEGADPTLTPPRTWRKEATTAWSTLPAEVRAEIHKRETDIFQGIEAYKTDASFGKSVQGALAPYMPTLKQYGIDPVAQVAGLMQAHQTLTLGTAEQKQALFTKLASDYGVDLGQLTATESFVDPAVRGLQQQVQTIQSQLTASEAAQREQAVQAQTRLVESFAADPKNTYFKDVANDMVQLLESKVCSSLEEAYQKAIWMSPVVRQREMDRLQTERDAAARKIAEDKAAAARKAAAANVRTVARSGGGTAPTGSIDDTLQATLAEIQARTS